ncbi:unnamed protein product [Linum tenue]|uniref:RIN4 pathogenic type III effector avirulence factor Avr cleavage site domain-containing protein n=1 Tax=Linum tenue TaxID=586396 RepID=A0AAV0RUD7_9ROSI|nr:unnamed protein product [Linum tenue]
MEEEYYYRGGHVPAFGSWDWNNDLPFTQCFESARQAGFLRYSYSEDPDLYVAGDLYQNDVVTPTVIVVPRRPRQQGKVRQSRTKQGKTMEKQQQAEMGTSPPPKSTATTNTSLPRSKPKPVDEDLYKISPHLLYASTKPRKARTCFSFAATPVLSTTFTLSAKV